MAHKKVEQDKAFAAGVDAFAEEQKFRGLVEDLEDRVDELERVNAQDRPEPDPCPKDWAKCEHRGNALGTARWCEKDCKLCPWAKKAEEREHRCLTDPPAHCPYRGGTLPVWCGVMQTLCPWAKQAEKEGEVEAAAVCVVGKAGDKVKCACGADLRVPPAMEPSLVLAFSCGKCDRDYIAIPNRWFRGEVVLPGKD